MMQPQLRRLLADWLPLAVLLFLVIFPHLVGWMTESSPFGVPRGDRMIMRGESVRWQSVMIEIFILSILAMSYNLMFGFTGVLSFGHALFFGLGGYIVGMMLEFTQMETGVALAVGFVVAMVVCGLLGLFIGVVSLRLRGVYFAIFTLAIAEMVFIFFGRFELTRAEAGFPISTLPTWLDPTQSRLNFYYLSLMAVAFVFFFIRRLVNSPTGAVFKAIRENEDRAQAIGYNTLNYKLFSIFVAGIMAAFAGILQVLLNKKVGPEVLSITYTVDPLLMTIIGGIGTFVGPLIGAVGLHLMDIVLREATFTLGSAVVKIADIWGLLLGGIFIAVVIIFPQGVMGTWARLRGRWSRPKPIATPADVSEASPATNA